MSAALEFRNVSAGYGRQRVLFDISLSVPSGSVVAVLGPNGAGKTTTLRVASGLIQPEAGEVSLFGEPVTGLSAAPLARRGVCHVPEGRGVFPNLTVEENLLMHSYLVGRRSRAEQAELAFTRFPRLAERRRQVAGTMSGGEQQMLALSRALTTSPRLLLLDELSMGLAPLVAEELLGVVRDLAAEGITTVLVEQLVSDALQIADHVIVLEKGRVAMEGEPAVVADHLVSAYLGG
ncbi:ABC transporter ATP-binding protein [Streptomyces sp. NPDC002143]